MAFESHPRRMDEQSIERAISLLRRQHYYKEADYFESLHERNAEQPPETLK